MSWTPDPDSFVHDLEAKPERLRTLASRLAAEPWPIHERPARVVFLGLGSSRFAALAGASRLRAIGVDAVAEYASAEAVHPGGPGTLAVGISASGSTPETVAALARHAGAGSATVALTNADTSDLADAAADHLGLAAGPEPGGVACRSYLHTIVRVLQLEAQLAPGPDIGRAAAAAADAIDHLLGTRDAWLGSAVDLLGGAGRTFVLAPNERLANAEQGALMFREGPRVDATACETADWLHVDVYLTKPLGASYRALLFAGAAADAGVMTWVRERGAQVLAVGAHIEGARAAVRYPGEDDDITRLLTELTVAELAAAALWRRA